MKLSKYLEYQDRISALAEGEGDPRGLWLEIAEKVDPRDPDLPNLFEQLRMVFPEGVEIPGPEE